MEEGTRYDVSLLLKEGCTSGNSEGPEEDGARPDVSSPLSSLSRTVACPKARLSLFRKGPDRRVIATISTKGRWYTPAQEWRIGLCGSCHNYTRGRKNIPKQEQSQGGEYQASMSSPHKDGDTSRKTDNPKEEVTMQCVPLSPRLQ